jgi:hypothetical protein
MWPTYNGTPSESFEIIGMMPAETLYQKPGRRAVRLALLSGFVVTTASLASKHRLHASFSRHASCTGVCWCDTLIDALR